MVCACGTMKEHHAGCSKSPFSKAAGESKPEAYPQGYVEDFDELRTPLAGFSSILQKVRLLEPLALLLHDRRPSLCERSHSVCRPGRSQRCCVRFTNIFCRTYFSLCSNHTLSTQRPFRHSAA